MTIHFIGTHREKPLSSLPFDGIIKEITTSYLSLESKYLLTQFNYFTFEEFHLQQTSRINFDIKVSEVRGYISLISPYFMLKEKTEIFFEGAYKKNNYRMMPFNSYYVGVTKKYFRLDSRYKIKSYNNKKFHSRYVSFPVSTIYFNSSYIFKSTAKQISQITLNCKYTKIAYGIEFIGGIKTDGYITIDARKNITETYYKGSSISIDYRYNMFHNLYECADFSLKNYININGIDSILFGFKILETENVGDYYSPYALFSAQKKEVGGFISHYWGFVIRREIKDYKFFDNNLSIPLIFKNIPFKNPIQNFKFVNVSKFDSFKIKNLFGFPEKVRKILFLEDLKKENIVNLDLDIMFHNITNNYILFRPIKSKDFHKINFSLKCNYLFKFMFSKVITVHIGDLKQFVFIVTNKTNNRLTNYLNTTHIPVEAFTFEDFKKNDIIYLYKTVKDVYLAFYNKSHTSFNSLIKNNGTSFISFLHRKMFSSEDYTIYNTIVTVNPQKVDVGGLMFKGHYFNGFVGGILEKIEKITFIKNETSFPLIRIGHLEIAEHLKRESLQYEVGIFSYERKNDTFICDNLWGGYFSVVCLNVTDNIYSLCDIRILK
jgi:hypothetical protein